MLLQNLKIYKYKIPLISPLRMKGLILSDREGLIIELTTDGGLVGLGDCAPFPNLHIETLDDCIAVIKSLKDQIVGRYIPVENANVLSFFDDLQIPHSLRFALDCALINITAESKNLGFSEFINPNRQNEIEVNGLLTGDAEHILSEAARLTESGFTALKIKVGVRLVDEEIELIHKLRDNIGDKIQLRADANRAWSFEQACEFARGVADCNLEYIEEPISEPGRLNELYIKTGLPIAFDESLYGKSPDDIELFDGLKALVLKPSAIVSIKNSLRFIELAEKQNIKPVISSAFESGIGLYALAGLSACIKTPAAAGLDTYKWFKHDIAQIPFSAENGEINISHVDKAVNSLNYELLEGIIL